MQMVIANVNYSDSFLWRDSKNNYIVRVQKNDTFWENNYPKAKAFFRKFLLPELLGCYFSNKKKEIDLNRYRNEF